MMYLSTIDCGTTNSRVYIVDERGKIFARATKKVGVRDTAITGSKEALKTGLKETFFLALEQAGLELKDVAFAISSGMITSEIGLVEIPHLWAPAGLRDLAAHIEEVRDLSVFPVEIPIYFIRGIKNRYDPDTATIPDVGRLDFMRGEEAQIAGLLATYSPGLPLTVVVLSSHTKFIAVDGTGMILGSITTVSGQVYDAIVKETSIGKSIRPDDDFDDGGYLDPLLLDAAYDWVASSGFLRSLLMPRFLDTLLRTKWYERKLFVESAIASEDLKATNQFEALGFPLKTDLVLIGNARRCSIYERLFREKRGVTGKISKISDDEQVDSLSINGALELARRAGLLPS
jgi:2-dehydro-3-deoxygalactonokinase